MHKEHDDANAYDDIRFEPFIALPQYQYTNYPVFPNIMPRYGFQPSIGMPVNPLINPAMSFPASTSIPMIPAGSYVYSLMPNTPLPMPEVFSKDQEVRVQYGSESPPAFNIHTPMEALRNLDLELEEDTCAESTRDVEDNIGRILKKIENNNPAIFNTLSAYKIPYPISRLLVKRIIRLSLSYYSDMSHGINLKD
ncbi:hypothetical protein [Clostridium polynesiense]|uniref:hypothetical protein n=1 Tax=Clostridium polynesiense TaxID=1325933 RepID=UPI000694BCE6|nr:hypothetical protein [Clostridium polynesiense]